MSRKTHGLKYHSLYATWDSMMQEMIINIII